MSISMAAVGPSLSRSPFQGDSHSFGIGVIRSKPILSSAAAASSKKGEAMDVTHAHNDPAALMGPPALIGPNGDRVEHSQHGHHEQQQPLNGGSSYQSVGAAAAVQQPKVVQTAFIHKLYKFALQHHSLSRHSS